MVNYFIVPGLGNSGLEHWQTFFEKSGSNFKRIEQQEWDAPNCNNWIETIDKAISGYDPSTVILIAHSLGCCTVAHWATEYNKKIKGALLVAPSDIENPATLFLQQALRQYLCIKLILKLLWQLVAMMNGFQLTGRNFLLINGGVSL
jgi:predicted alpha/beta hydrolase family esterase